MHNPVVEKHDGRGGGGGGRVKLIFLPLPDRHQTDGERTIRVSINLILTSSEWRKQDIIRKRCLMPP